LHRTSGIPGIGCSGNAGSWYEISDEKVLAAREKLVAFDPADRQLI
jgi:hypothetical protein